MTSADFEKIMIINDNNKNENENEKMNKKI